MTQPTAIVVGGGIGGLVAALALIARGWDVSIHERASTLESIGAGIVLAPNAVRAVDSVGLGSALREVGHVPKTGALRDNTGRLIQRLKSVEGLDGTPTVTLHRADLVKLLLEALPPGTLRLASEVREFRNLGADVVIGADGIGSSVRQSIFPDSARPVSAGFTAWRAVIDGHRLSEPSESWGKGQIFGAIPLSNERTYIYATARSAHPPQHAEGVASWLRDSFGSWHDPIPALVSGIRDEQMLSHPVLWSSTPLRHFHSGRIALVGDAAHAMTPNLGQGACMAIEDAVTLGALLDANDIEGSLAQYSAARVRRTTRIARQSHRVGRLAHVSHAVPVALRNTALRTLAAATPATLTLKPNTLFDWMPPQSL